MFEDKMRQPKSSATGAPDYILRDLDESRLEDVLEVYSLLQDAMGTDSVEDLRSFRRTVSPLTDPRVLPRVVVASTECEVIGVMVGATLKNVGAGFIAYSAVQEASRRRGIYVRMRSRVLKRFTEDDGVEYVVSELDEGSWLFSKCIRDWNGVALPGHYEQPQAQGLQAKALRLVAQPVNNGITPGPFETLALVREIYEQIYRIKDAEGNESYRRISASLTRSGPQYEIERNGTNRK